MLSPAVLKIDPAHRRFKCNGSLDALKNSMTRFLFQCWRASFAIV